jgi:glycosyltransferase involved in cell wall biosynthesis
VQTVERPLTYAAVTPARNEYANLTRLAQAMTAQRRRPAAWIIVDDASDDGTGELAAALARNHDWITATSWTEGAGSALSNGRREGRDLLAFRLGVGRLPGGRDPDVVVKVDADVSFEPDFFERLVGAFEDEPDLGIASGACWELEDGEWTRRKVVESHPRGATRAYRWACVDDLMALEPKMGWDGLDEVRVNLRGYETRTIVDLPFRHHRPEGGRERGRLGASALKGRACWYMGYRPSYLLLRALYRSRRDPAAIAMVWGYAAAAAGRVQRVSDPRMVARLREQQRLRATLRRGAPP